MIGYTTFFFKNKDGTTDAYFGPNYWIKEVQQYCKKKNINLFNYFRRELKEAEIQAENVSEETIIKALRSQSCRNEDKGFLFYSELCADMYFLLDLSKKKMFESKWPESGKRKDITIEWVEIK